MIVRVDTPYRAMAARPSGSESRLPIHAYREQILHELRSSPVIIVLGDTGCGKTTQLPQILAEEGFGPICITQPRRVAAITAARRVAQECGTQLGDEVGFAVRFEHECTSKTRIKFVTDGVLLREAVTNPQARHAGRTDPSTEPKRPPPSTLSSPAQLSATACVCRSCLGSTRSFSTRRTNARSTPTCSSPQ